MPNLSQPNQGYLPPESPCRWLSEIRLVSAIFCRYFLSRNDLQYRDRLIFSRLHEMRLTQPSKRILPDLCIESIQNFKLMYISAVVPVVPPRLLLLPVPSLLRMHAGVALCRGVNGGRRGPCCVPRGRLSLVSVLPDEGEGALRDSVMNYMVAR